MLQKNKDDFLQDLISKLQYFNMAENTIKTYQHYVCRLLFINNY